ncbi:MAG: aminomethyltransferase family protein [Candidatus Eisenbacteria bacterium]
MSLESPVLRFLETIGAHRGERFGHATAAHFGDPAWEYEAVRRSVGLIDISHRGAVRVRGADRVRFLENMLSNRVEDLEAGTGRTATLLTPQGKIVALFRLLAFPESFLALLPREGVDALIRGLDPFIILEEVVLEDESLRWGTIHVAGPESAKLLSALTGSPMPHLPPGHSRSLSFPGLAEAVLAVRDCPTGEDGFDLLAPREKAAELWKVLLSSGSPKPFPVGLDPFDILRVEAGTPVFGRDVGLDLGPLEAGLDEAISFDKGCYPGQEVVAKTRHRGKPPKRLIGLKIDGEHLPAPGAAVLMGEAEVGRVTSAVRSPHLGGIVALAVVRTSAIEKGEPLRARTGGGDAPAEIAETPFR